MNRLTIQCQPVFLSLLRSISLFLRYMGMTDDRQLASDCAKGDRKAGEELYRRYSRRLLSLCMRYMPDKSSAEDVMHDSFVRILESIKRFSYKGPGSLYSWMARIAVNRCFDSARMRRRIRMGFLDESLLESLPDEETEMDIGGIPQDELRRMVESLPEAYRTVFKLWAVEGLSHKEIAEILRIKEKSSASNLSRARAILAGKIREYNDAYR